MVSDTDNIQSSIEKSIMSISNTNILTAAVRNDSLLVTPIAGQSGNVDIQLQFNSNGKLVTKDISVDINLPNGVSEAEGSGYCVYPTITTGGITIERNTLSTEVFLFDMQGQLLQTVHSQSLVTTLDISSYPSGMYLMRIGSKIIRIVRK